MCVCVHVCVRACMHRHHARTHARTHAHTHTRTRAHAHTHALLADTILRPNDVKIWLVVWWSLSQLMAHCLTMPGHYMYQWWLILNKNNTNNWPSAFNQSEVVFNEKILFIIIIFFIFLLKMFAGSKSQGNRSLAESMPTKPGHYSGCDDADRIKYSLA